MDYLLAVFALALGLRKARDFFYSASKRACAFAWVGLAQTQAKFFFVSLWHAHALLGWDSEFVDAIFGW